MREQTDEAQKVLRKGGDIWHAVFRKIDAEKLSPAAEDQILAMFL